MVDSSDSPSAPSPPALGTLIDNGALELVEILGYGGYGIVYRAIDTYSSNPASYAVKCLPHSRKRNAVRQRQLHLREITLHQLASAHPNVVTLHRVIEDYQYTFIVMDYCEDGDLFSQILHHRRYLGNNDLIKEVFLQLLDAVEYCHSLNIYHRDLKPENVLCFDGGLRLAITDFGLATTDKMSTEFRTGSVYHMSPECQGGAFSVTRSYSPLFNDIWSLGIILLNLITGRNPWKSASADDCTFQAYVRDPRRFLPTVLPISAEVNRLLTRVLEVDWRKRMPLREMRMAVENIESFYAPDVIFEDSMARCPWEAGIEVDNDSDESSIEAPAEPQEIHQSEHADYASAWSNDTDSEMVFAGHSTVQEVSWMDEESRAGKPDLDSMESYARSMSPSPTPPLFTTTKLFEDLQTPDSGSTYSVSSSAPSIPSLPKTPNGPESTWSQAAQSKPSKKLTLAIDTVGCHTSYYDPSVNMLSAQSSTMQTALESQYDGYELYADSVLCSTGTSTKASMMMESTEDVGMIITPTAVDEDEDMHSTYTYPTIDAYDNLSSARPESPILGLDLGAGMQSSPMDQKAESPHPHYAWDRLASSPQQDPQTPAYSFITFGTTPAPSPQAERPQWPSFSFHSSSPIPSPASDRSKHTFPFLAGPPSPAPLPIRPPLSPRSRDRKTRTSSFLHPIRLAFPRRSSSPIPRPLATNSAHRTDQTDSFPTSWVFSPSTSGSPEPQPYRCLSPIKGDRAATYTEPPRGRQRTGHKRLRSARDWFSPSKFFAAVLPS